MRGRRLPLLHGWYLGGHEPELRALWRRADPPHPSENADLQMEELRKNLVDEVFEFAGGAEQHDDMTMVLLKVL